MTSSSTRAAEVTVTVDGLRSANGNVIFALDDSASSWDDKSPPTASGRVKAQLGAIVFVVHDVKPGTFAIAVFHDENANGKLDSNFLGIPKEPWGFSNNPSALRKARFDEASFGVGEQGVSLTIHLRHVGSDAS